MFANIPDEVARQIGKQFRRGVAEAQEDFENQQADEDAVTGSLGGSLRAHVRGEVIVGGVPYKWRTRQRFFRGRGPGAPQRTLGIDAMLELELWDEQGNVAKRKSLPLQAKKGWSNRDPVLEKQADQMLRMLGGGVVLNYTDGRFEAVRVDVVKDASGNKRDVPGAAVGDLGDVLAEDFLECTIGSEALYFDAERNLVVVGGGDPRIVRLSVSRRIRTKIRRG